MNKLIMDKNKKINIVLHFIVWFGLFSMPYVLWYGQEQEINRLIAHFWIPLVFYAILFYFNYFVLIERFLFIKKTFLFIIINLAFIAFFSLLREHIENNFFQDIARRASKPGPPFEMVIYMQLLSYMPPLLFAIAIKTTKRWAQTEAEHKDADHYKLKSELQHLQYQLQPHFFFNSLNNIYSMVDFSPEQAKKSIHNLSKLMRYMLYETNMDLVLLSNEIDFIKKYIDLMKLRISDKTKVICNFPSDVRGIKIAPLLFISLIENAFKHGVSAIKKSQIDIILICDENRVTFFIANDNFPKKTEDISGSGIGLQNLEKRLQLLYPNKYSFENSVKDNRFLVTLTLETN